MSPVIPIPPPHPPPLQAFWRAMTQFDRKKISLPMGLRNALGIVWPLAVGVHLGYPGSGLVAATGALNVAAADGVDSYRNRAVRMFASSLIGGIGVYLGALTARNEIAVIAVRALWAFAAGLVVCLGTVAADIGMISLVVIVIYSAQAMTTAHAAWSGLIAFGAGILQMALSVALWPIRGRQPERNIIGDFYLELAKSATVPPNPYGAPLASQQSTKAQEALSPFSGDHAVEAERLFLLVSQAERIRLSLFALGRNHARIRREDADEPSAAVIDRFLESASSVLHSIGATLRGEPVSGPASASLEEADHAAEAFRQSEELPDRSAIQETHLSEARYQMDALVGQLRAALELSTGTTSAGEAAYTAREVRAPWHLRLSGWLATLRANLSLDSSACRHAIRLTLCIVLGEIIARSFSLPRSYWLPMTVALVLKPDFGNTFSRGALRLAGTYTGLMMATILFHFLSPAAWVQVLWIGILAFILRSLGRANYGIMVTAISAAIVFLFSLNGIAPKDVIAARALNTTIGGALALIIYLVWPTREQTQVPQSLANLLDSYRLYFRALSLAYIDGHAVDAQQLDRLRVNGRRARSNLETSVDRLSAEPYANAARLRLLNAMLASSHRFIHSAMALEAGLASGPPPPAGEAFKAFSQDLEKLLYFLAQLLRGSEIPPESLPDLREDHNRLIHSRAGSDSRDAWLNIETDRMTNSLNTLAEQLFRYGSSEENVGGFGLR